jgi:hypothetical protein
MSGLSGLSNQARDLSFLSDTPFPVVVIRSPRNESFQTGIAHRRAD